MSIEILFFNVPSNVSWDPELLFALTKELGDFYLTDCSSANYGSSEPGTRVSVVLAGIPVMETRMAKETLSKKVLLFLEAHGVLRGSDVVFAEHQRYKMFVGRRFSGEFEVTCLN